MKKKLKLKKVKIANLSREHLSTVKGGDGHTIGPKSKGKCDVKTEL